MAKRKSNIPFEVITVWLNGQTFTADGSPQYDTLQIADNAIVTFSNGVTFKARCNKLLMGKNVKIVGTGADGENGQTPPKIPDIRCEGTPAQHPGAGGIHARFLRYAQGTTEPSRSIGYNASRPTRGGPGATISIAYHHYTGYEFDKKKQAFVLGGRGGRGAPGGEGATVHCTINPCGGVLQGPSGIGSSDAADGPLGSFDLIEYKLRGKSVKNRKRKK
jgi:hypothetical protein